MKKEFNYWPYIIIALFLLVFAGFAPFMFSKLSGGPVFGQDTGPIGDTIGGITAPFLSLIGSILVFAALRAQIQANDIVLRQLNKEEAEKQKDLKNKLEILILDIEAILNDLKKRGERMKEFSEKTVSDPFGFNLLLRTVSRSYERAHKLDREYIYKGIKLYCSQEESWVKNFHNLYSELDFLPAFFDDIYSKYDSTTKELVDQKRQLSIQIDDMLSFASEELQEIKDESDVNELAEHPYHGLVNQFVVDWYRFLKSNEQTVDALMLKAKNDFFHPLMESLLVVTNTRGRDSFLNELMNEIRAINMGITRVEFETKEFGKSVKNAHAMLLQTTDEKKCTYDGLKDLKDWILDSISS